VDKIVQRAVAGVLNAIYEADFRGFSYGFRPRRGAHQALDALATGIMTKKVNWVLDADIRDFFGQLDRDWLMRFLRHRIADERVLRLIGKWLAAGVIENGTWAETGRGSPQGGRPRSPRQRPASQVMANPRARRSSRSLREQSQRLHEVQPHPPGQHNPGEFGRVPRGEHPRRHDDRPQIVATAQSTAA
jgi:retron-type reverse transcriptase